MKCREVTSSGVRFEVCGFANSIAVVRKSNCFTALVFSILAVTKGPLCAKTEAFSQTCSRSSLSVASTHTGTPPSGTGPSPLINEVTSIFDILCGVCVTDTTVEPSSAHKRYFHNDRRLFYYPSSTSQAWEQFAHVYFSTRSGLELLPQVSDFGALIAEEMHW